LHHVFPTLHYRSVTPYDFPHLDTLVKKIVNEKQNFERLEMKKEDLLQMFQVILVHEVIETYWKKLEWGLKLVNFYNFSSNVDYFNFELPSYINCIRFIMISTFISLYVVLIFVVSLKDVFVAWYSLPRTVVNSKSSF